jgi:hypothetical protein
MLKLKRAARQATAQPASATVFQPQPVDTMPDWMAATVNQTAATLGAWSDAWLTADDQRAWR